MIEKLGVNDQKEILADMRFESSVEFKRIDSEYIYEILLKLRYFDLYTFFSSLCFYCSSLITEDF